jgi:uncharacterized protein YndB with AHSA1/START domain
MGFDHDYRLRIAAPRATVFDRLLRIEHIARWFCGWARIEPKVGGSFKFGGETSIFLPEGSAWETTIEEGEVLRRFAFTWPIRGTATRVAYDLEDRGTGGSLLRVRHSGVPFAVTTCGSVQDAWRVCLGNLKAISEDRGDSVRPDHTEPTTLEVRLACIIDAPTERVFGTLADAAQFGAWISGRSADIAGTAGRPGSHSLDGHDAEVLEIEAGARLVLKVPRAGGLRVAFNLETKASGTAVYLSETGFGSGERDRVIRHRGRWADRLVGLRNLVESGDIGFQNAYEDQVHEA